MTIKQIPLTDNILQVVFTDPQLTDKVSVELTNEAIEHTVLHNSIFIGAGNQTRLNRIINRF